MALLYKVEIKEIYIYPLGGITKLNMPLNINFLKEFNILIMGPIFQLFAYSILLKILPDKKELITIYNFGILSFNLLPIYPLDGGKLLKLVLDRFIAYKRSLKLIINLSYIIVILIFINKIKKINIIIMTIFLIIIISNEKKKINLIYQKFILERYLNNYHFKNSKIVNNIDSFYRNRRHIIKKDNKYYLEKEYLDNLYKK